MLKLKGGTNYPIKTTAVLASGRLTQQCLKRMKRNRWSLKSKEDKGLSDKRVGTERPQQNVCEDIVPR